MLSGLLLLSYIALNCIMQKHIKVHEKRFDEGQRLK